MRKHCVQWLMWYKLIQVDKIPHAMECGSGHRKKTQRTQMESFVWKLEKSDKMCADEKTKDINHYSLHITVCWMHNALLVENFRSVGVHNLIYFSFFFIFLSHSHDNNNNIKWLFILCPRHSVFVSLLLLLLLSLTTLWNQLTGYVLVTEQLFCGLSTAYI